jgi:hypothetical protein
MLHKIGKPHPWKKLKKECIDIKSLQVAGLLQAAQFIADSWRRVSTKTIPLGGFKRSDLEMPSEVSNENDMCTTWKLQSFIRLQQFSVLKLLLSKLQQNTRRQKIRKVMRMTQLSMKG